MGLFFFCMSVDAHRGVMLAHVNRAFEPFQ